MELDYFDSVNFKPSSILDIGCNRGQFYHLCIKKWGGGLKNNMVLVDGNLNLRSHLDDLGVNYHLELLSDKEKIISFYLTKTNPIGTGASIYRENTHFYDDENVIIQERKTTTLDNLFSNSIGFDLIKMDVQGSEIDILRGGIDICKRAFYIILEVSMVSYNSGAPMSDEVYNYMKTLDFEFSHIANVHHKTGGEFSGLDVQKDVIFKNIRKDK